MQEEQTDHQNDHSRRNLKQIVRFGIVGFCATLIQYGIYWLLIHLIRFPGHTHLWLTAAMTIAYLISFVFNFIASTHFTFQVKANAKRGAGFLFSHIVNYFLQMATLNLFLLMGMGHSWAPIPMFCICVPVNFLLVRFFLTRV
ncbi:MAG: GtrA family protein [Prevotella sp.]|jgi:putative flippase GtrA|uniref:GtrA family protein n=1 Tax=Segatella cerevisiae TaxID=2053716 RepID=A0ABT1BW01_9BACT|nr:GtrA family protein [Segatella cerevisiae]MCH3995199.1 GtrA family protein [Prevotella sp.]MCI1246027.1 GtrA family protein [Prevotella sp.]MCO6025254.1 GtrA family protein [Segatella cerevisiae]